MPYFPAVQTVALTQLPTMIPIEGGIFAMGSHALNQRWGDCPPHLVQVDSFQLAETCLTVGELKELNAGQVFDEEDQGAPDNTPAILSWDDAVLIAQSASARLQRQIGLPTEAEWEYAARTRVDVRQFMEAHNIGTMQQLQEGLIAGTISLENFVPLARDEQLTLGSRLMVDPKAPDFVSELNKAGLIIAWTKFGTKSGGLDPNEAYYNQVRRGPVQYGPPNQQGLYDMSGGMWEWCGDVYDKNAYRALPAENPFKTPNGSQARSLRVRRGGSWRGDDPDGLRAACRYVCRPGVRGGAVGVRLAAVGRDSG